MDRIKRLMAASCMMMVCLLVTGALVFRASIVQAEQGSLLFDGNVQQVFTSEDGLLSTSSTAIAQTSEGFIWIGGYGGLVRYDGRNFQAFAEGDLANISALLGGPEGSLYIASQDSGIHYYQDGLFTSLSETEASNVVECLALSPDGTVWFGTENGIGYIDETQTPRMVSVPEIEGEFIHRIICEEDRLRMVTRSGRVFTYDGRTCEETLLPGEEEVRNLYRTEAGEYYLGSTGNTIWHCDGELQVLEVIPAEGLKCINDLSLTEDGILWICADNGIAAYRDGELRIQRMDVDNSVDLMMLDTEGNAWFVSSRQGVLEVSGSRFGNVSQSAGLPGMVVNAITELDGRLYIGHDEGLLIMDAETYEVIEDPAYAELASVRIRALYADAEGTLWAGTRGKGLLAYRPDGTLQVYNAETYPVIASDNFRCIYDSGEALICGTDAGAYVIDGEEVRSVVTDADSFRLRVLGISRLRDTLYLGTDGYGIYLVENGEITGKLTADDGLTSNVAMKFCPGRDDGMWSVTGNKIVYIDSSRQIRVMDELPSSNNLDFLILNGEVWIFTGSGIFRTTESSLLEDDTIQYTSYRHADGLPYEIVPNSNQCLNGDVLYICGSGGIASMKLSAEEDEEAHYQLAIDQVLADGEPLKEQDEVCEIGQDVRRIGIDAHVLTYRADNPMVFYILEGFDDEKTVLPLRELKTVSYTNLSGGEYLFRFGTVDEMTGEAADELTLKLHKAYKWHERGDIRAGIGALAVAILALGAFVLTRLHARKVDRKLAARYREKERSRLREMAYKDYLTGLYNRHYLEYWMEKVLPGAAYPITFVSADCNNLKRINDSFGHKSGDRLLTEMGSLLLKHFAGDAFDVIRMGGDEFLVLCRGVPEEEVKKILTSLQVDAASREICGIPISFASGLCTQTEEEFNFDEGLRLSDLAMLEEKDRFHGR